MSIRIKAGCSSRAIVSPISASAAVMTSWPADVSSMVASFMFVGLSSTTRILAMSGHDPPQGHRTLHFCIETLAVEFRLLDDGHHESVELVAILGGNLSGRHRNHGNPLRAGVLLQRGHHVEA